jgi:uncharacterized protein YggE
MKILLLILVSVCLVNSVEAQVSGNSNYQQTTPKNNPATAEVPDKSVTLTVSGLLNARADAYVAIFNVVQLGETPEITEALMMARVRKFKIALQRVGIDTTTVKTDMIAFVPKYDINVINKIFSKSYNEVPDGFELQKNLIIRYTKAADLDAIVTAAAGVEIYDLAKVDYFLNDVKKLYDQLRTQCMAILKERVTSLESTGFKIDTLKRIFSDDFGTILPQNRYDQYQAVARPSMDAVKKSASGASLKFHRADIAPSRYYAAQSYDDYDLVINPVVDEPMVQLTYQVKIKFPLDAEDYAVKNYLLIGPNGQLQKLDLAQHQGN